MAVRRDGWDLGGVVDFERSLGADGDVVVGGDVVRAVEEATVGVKDPVARRRVGFQVWLDKVVGENGVGGRVNGVRGMLALVLFALAVVSGWGTIEGLYENDVSAFHVPSFLVATVGWQWLMIVILLVLYPFRMRVMSGLTFFQQGMSWLIFRLSGGRAVEDVWKRVRREGGAMQGILKWPLVRMTQGAMVGYNLSLVVSFLSVLGFRDVRFYWTTTFGEDAAGVVWRVVNFLGGAWGWLDDSWVPGEAGIAASQWRLEEGKAEALAGMDAVTWWPFLVGVILIWGFLPRFLLWVFAVWSEGRAWGAVRFESPRHRKLWRALTDVGGEIQVEPEVVADGGLLLDWAGTGVDLGDVRGFCLRKLRINPVEVLKVGFLDGEEDAAAWERVGEVMAWETMREVVICVEGWELVPGEMRDCLGKVREVVGGEFPVVVLILGKVVDGLRISPSAEEVVAWEGFIDGLGDAGLEVVGYSGG